MPEPPPQLRRLAAVALFVGVLLALATPAAGRVSAVTAAAPTTAAVSEPVTLWYFWGEGCPYCVLASDWLVDLRADHPDVDVREVEVWQDRAGQEQFVDMLRARGEEPSGVPTFILDDEVWVGFSEAVATDIERTVAGRLAAAEAAGEQPVARDPDARSTLDLGPFGSVDAAAQPLAAATVLIAFVDGFNPCSLWVLTVLLAMILHTQSRARIAAVGGTFLLVTATIYGLFIAGLFAVLAVAAHLRWIQVAVALLALSFAALSIKDYFAYKQGLSLSIPDRLKPRIYRGGRAVRRSDRRLPATLGITVLFAAGVALIELPCTAGFPVVWTSLVTEAGIVGTAFVSLLAVYLVVYLAVEVAIVLGALVTMRATRLQEAHGRTLKLVGGTVMAAIAVVLLTDPSIMERLTGSLAVIGAALGAAALVLLVDRARRQQHAG